MQRVTADAVADRSAETSAGAYSCLHAQMLRNTAVGESAVPGGDPGCAPTNEFCSGKNALERT